jgi:Zn-dependent membrane protease YugP
MFAGVCAIVLALNIGTLAVEFNANKRLFNWLDDRFARDEDTLYKLREILGSVAIREVGDILSSPRYFFLSALPGTSSARPLKKESKD